MNQRNSRACRAVDVAVKLLAVSVAIAAAQAVLSGVNIPARAADESPASSPKSKEKSGAEQKQKSKEGDASKPDASKPSAKSNRGDDDTNAETEVTETTTETTTDDSSNQSGGELIWSRSLEKSLEEAKSANKYVLADVYTEWCGWCHKLDKDTFSNPTMVSYLKEKFICVKVDAEERTSGRGVARKYRIHGYPCALVFEPSGKFIGKISGYYEADDYRQSIDNLLKNPPADPFEEEE